MEPLAKHLGTLREVNQGGGAVADRLNASDARSTRSSTRISRGQRDAESGALLRSRPVVCRPHLAERPCPNPQQQQQDASLPNANGWTDRRGQLNNLGSATTQGHSSTGTSKGGEDDLNNRRPEQESDAMLRSKIVGKQRARTAATAAEELCDM